MRLKLSFDLALPCLLMKKKEKKKKGTDTTSCDYLNVLPQDEQKGLRSPKLLDL